ncbi:MAG: hypothetical protein WCT51_03370 [Candidatus Shapirobacteria bacterium]|jgi:hypothetical protein
MYTITFGGWYQRTTLHLTEIFNFLALGETNLGLDKNKILKLREGLEIISVSREIDYLEYVKANTKNGIEIRYYEDGLYILEINSKDAVEAKTLLEEYFEEKLNPAIAYIFSLGAPTPKILANIKLDHPVVISTKSKKIEVDENVFGKIYSKIEADDMSVYKTPKYIFIRGIDEKHVRALMEMQIFFREFKDQLERYLNIHRELWEEISEYKEKRVLLGKNIEKVRMKLDGYQKTINLIGSRINQMNVYVNTRSSIAKKMSLEEKLSNIFQYKFETLIDTHAYIKEVWNMTKDYLNTAIQVVLEVKSQANANTIQSLTLITTIGVVSGIIGYLSKDQFPKITLIGMCYYLILIGLTWLINRIVFTVANNKKYKLEFSSIKT